MPQRNAIKIYKSNAFYHIYNRGIDKRIIFKNDLDYNYFMNALKSRLTKFKAIDQNNDKKIAVIVPNNPYYGKTIELYAFCLMPNHFHLLVKQKRKRAITKFVASISTSYAMHFNKKYNRSGRLFEGVYRGVLIKSQEQLNTTIKYINDNYLELNFDEKQYPWSSKKLYQSKKKYEWIKTPG